MRKQPAVDRRLGAVLSEPEQFHPAVENDIDAVCRFRLEEDRLAAAKTAGPGLVEYGTCDVGRRGRQENGLHGNLPFGGLLHDALPPSDNTKRHQGGPPAALISINTKRIPQFRSQ